MRKLLRWIVPPSGWKAPVAILTGAMLGLVIYAFYISRAYSYLSDEPETCVNCHIMAPEYATWAHSAHRGVAVCNDCHVPHNNVFNKYYFKAKDGLRHATVFTLRNEPQVIFIKEEGREVVHDNCIRCHNDLLANPDAMLYGSTYFDRFENRVCWECHQETPHGRVHSLASVPYARVPVPESPVPVWIKKITDREQENPETHE